MLLNRKQLADKYISKSVKSYKITQRLNKISFQSKGQTTKLKMGIKYFVHTVNSCINDDYKKKII